MLAGCFVGEFGKLANEFFEDRTHLSFADDIGMQVDIGELLDTKYSKPALASRST